MARDSHRTCADSGLGEPAIAGGETARRVLPRELAHAVAAARDELVAQVLVGEHARASRPRARLRRSAPPGARRRPRLRGSRPPAPRRRAPRRSSPRGPGTRSLRRSTDTRSARPARATRCGRASLTGPASTTRRGRVGIEPRDRGVDIRARGAVRTRDHESNVRLRSGNQTERGDQVGEVLARFQRPDREHVRRAADALRRRARASPHRCRSAGMPSGTTTSLPDARSPGPKISSISFATNSDVVCTVAPRAHRPPDDRHHRSHFGRAQLGIADERAVVDADERRQAARRREVVRRVHDLRRLQPPVDTRRVVAQPTRGAARVPGSGRTASRAARGRAVRARASSTCKERAAARPRGLAMRRGSRRRLDRYRCAARAAA